MQGALSLHQSSRYLLFLTLATTEPSSSFPHQTRLISVDNDLPEYAILGDSSYCKCRDRLEIALLGDRRGMVAVSLFGVPTYGVPGTDKRQGVKDGV